MTENLTPADPAAYRVQIARNAHGVGDGITIRDAGGELLADYEDDKFTRLIALARDEEHHDPDDETLPSDRAFILAALRDMGIPILGEDDDDDGAESEAGIQRGMAFGLEPPEEPPHDDNPHTEARIAPGQKDEAEGFDWRDVPVLVQVDCAEDRLVLAGAFADANAEEPGLVPTLRELIRGDVDWCRFGGGAAPLVQVVRAIENPDFDADVSNVFKRTIAKADAADALLEAAREAEAFMSGFEDDDTQDPPLDDRLARLRAAIARMDGR